MILTGLRLLAIPIFALIYLLPYRWAHPTAAAIFILAAITDWLDGYLARMLSQATDFGAFLDPVADKLLVAAALVFIVAHNYVGYLAIPSAIIICREISISALREWMAEIGKRANISVNFIAKIKTAVQMIALILLIAYFPGVPDWILLSGRLLLWIASILTIWTMLLYLRAAWSDLIHS